MAYTIQEQAPSARPEQGYASPGRYSDLYAWAPGRKITDFLYLTERTAGPAITVTELAA